MILSYLILAVFNGRARDGQQPFGLAEVKELRPHQDPGQQILHLGSDVDGVKVDQEHVGVECRVVEVDPVLVLPLHLCVGSDHKHSYRFGLEVDQGQVVVVEHHHAASRVGRGSCSAVSALFFCTFCLIF